MFRSSNWEPRYLLDPVQYGNISLVADGLPRPPRRQCQHANAPAAKNAAGNANAKNAPAAAKKAAAAVKKR